MLKNAFLFCFVYILLQHCNSCAHYKRNALVTIESYLFWMHRISNLVLRIKIIKHFTCVIISQQNVSEFIKESSTHKFIKPSSGYGFSKISLGHFEFFIWVGFCPYQGFDSPQKWTSVFGSTNETFISEFFENPSDHIKLFPIVKNNM